MAKSLRWLPAFPDTNYKWPWHDRRPNVLPLTFFSFDSYLEPFNDSQRIHQARPWLGRVCLRNFQTSFPPLHYLNTLGIIWDIGSALRLFVFKSGSFAPVFDFRGATSSQNNSTWEVVQYFPSIAPPLPLSGTPILAGSPFGGGPEPWPHWRHPVQKGRWNSSTYAGYLSAQSPPPGFPRYLTAHFQFFFSNGCDASYDDTWRFTTDFGGWYPPAPITPEQESALVVALTSMGFNFDPDKLFFDYGTVP